MTASRARQQSGDLDGAQAVLDEIEAELDPARMTVQRETITRLRGTFHEIDGIRVMPTFHPAYLLRNPAAKREVWDDMKKVMAELKKAG